MLMNATFFKQASLQLITMQLSTMRRSTTLQSKNPPPRTPVGRDHRGTLAPVVDVVCLSSMEHPSHTHSLALTKRQDDTGALAFRWLPRVVVEI
mmetsp:Transcript_36145/g.106774  ORF Transcript_36145/g.106774 Transcript_36145/m.106774 type:complete len:94 (+) Transcript_36145:11-292(+)